MNYKKAQTYWDEKDKNNSVAPKQELDKWLDAFLKKHNTLALATGCDNYIDCTPIEYNYIYDKIYLFSEGGHKFVGLEKNKNISATIYENYIGFNTISSVQLYGTCSIVEKDSDEYFKLIDYKKIPRIAVDKLDLYLLRLDLTKAQILSSDFKKSGFSNRQVIKY